MTGTRNRRPADLSRMAGGHEIWLEAAGFRPPQAELCLFYGDAMRPDGSISTPIIDPVAVGPGGMRQIPAVTQEDGHHRLTFPAVEDGWYTVTAGLAPVTIALVRDRGFLTGTKALHRHACSAAAYRQMATAIIPVGDAGEYLPCHVPGTFAILPDRPRFRTGSPAGFTALYRGRPAPGIRICAVSRETGWLAPAAATDDDGRAELAFPSAGPWMVLARYRDRALSSEGEYDETVFVTTLLAGAGGEVSVP